jgi:hypothetical protein
MKRVVCINDKNLPEGASVKEGEEYAVELEYINGFDQKVYIISGAVNSGTTKMGMNWVGYRSERFKETENYSISKKEYEFALN